jgi:hypothetical protein
VLVASATGTGVVVGGQAAVAAKYWFEPPLEYQVSMLAPAHGLALLTSRTSPLDWLTML